MRKTSIVWMVAAVLGLGLMFASHRESMRCTELTQWANGIMFVAHGDLPREASERGLTAMVRFLPPGREAKDLAEILGVSQPHLRDTLLWNLQETVIGLPDLGKIFTEEDLESGRLPKNDRKEVLAGYGARGKKEVKVGDDTFQIVGVLRRGESLFNRAYLVPDDKAWPGLFNPQDPAVKRAVVLTSKQVREIQEQLEEEFPRQDFKPVAHSVRLEPAWYYLYILGMAVFLAGGSVLMIRGYCRWADRATGKWLGLPLAAIRDRQRLLGAVHVAYFGLTIVGALLVYSMPNVQRILLLVISEQIQTGQGLLGWVGQLYQSGNIPLAAAGTLAVNFLLGSLLWITVPSLVVPGIGFLTALFRAILWGFLLMPTYLALSGPMLLHSGTLLLEGEGYILAAFFALLIPVELLFPKDKSPAALRFGRAIVLNLKACLLVFAVLAIAAIYEAIEVIGQASL